MESRESKIESETDEKKVDWNFEYDDYINKQDKSNWEYEEALGVHLVPNSVIAEFVKGFAEQNNHDHKEMFEWAETHRRDPGGYFADELYFYYKHIVEGDIITPPEIESILKEGKESLTPVFAEIEKEHKGKEKQVEFRDGARIEISFSEKLVKFPEYLVEQTGGVEGYLRKEMSWKDIEKAYSEVILIEDLKRYLGLAIKAIPVEDGGSHYYLKNKKYFSSFSGVDSLDSFKGFLDVVQFLACFFEKKGIGYDHQDEFIKLLNEEEKDVTEDKILKMTKVFQGLLRKLGNNYLSHESLHVMGLYHPRDKHRGEFEKKMLLQKVYSPEDYSSLDQAGTEDFGYNVFSIQNGKVVLLDRDRRNEKEGLEEYKKRLCDHGKNKNIFLMHNFGLNVSNEGIWDLDHGPHDDSLYMNSALRPHFGFSHRNGAYGRYISSVKDLFDKNPVIKHEFIADKDPFYYNTEPSHPLIPIVIGYPGIPELRWCHASHAYMSTKNGISVIEMISSKEEFEKQKSRLKSKKEKK